MGQAESWRKVQGAGKHQSFGHAGLAAHESGGDSIHKFQVAAPFVRPNVIERAHVFIAQAEVDGGRPGNAPVILNEGVAIPLTEIHVRDARLTLLDDGQAQKETCQRGASAGGLQERAPGNIGSVIAVGHASTSLYAAAYAATGTPAVSCHRTRCLSSLQTGVALTTRWRVTRCQRWT